MAEYIPFNMCPFTMAQVGGGGGLGFDVQSYVWTHSKCIEEYCKMWTYVQAEKGVIGDCVFVIKSLNPDERKFDAVTKCNKWQELNKNK